MGLLSDGKAMCSNKQTLRDWLKVRVVVRSGSRCVRDAPYYCEVDGPLNRYYGVETG